jgi:hypothetical protein
MSAQGRIEKVERMIKTMRRDGVNAAEACGDFESGDAIRHAAEAALEMLFDLSTELEPEGELLAA